MHVIGKHRRSTFRIECKYFVKFHMTQKTDRVVCYDSCWGEGDIGLACELQKIVTSKIVNFFLRFSVVSCTNEKHLLFNDDPPNQSFHVGVYRFSAPNKRTLPYVKAPQPTPLPPSNDKRSEISCKNEKHFFFLTMTRAKKDFTSVFTDSPQQVHVR